MRMKTVRFRRRAFVAVAISLVCVVALIRTSLVTTTTSSSLINDEQQQQQQQLETSENNNKNKKERLRNSGVGTSDLLEKDRKAFYSIKATISKESQADEKSVTAKINGYPNNDGADQPPNRGDIAPVLQQQQQQQPNNYNNNNNNNNVDSNNNNNNNNYNNLNPNIPVVDVQQRGNSQNSQMSTVSLDSLEANITNGVYPIIVNGKFVPSRRIVHLDLKGAPPQLYYFEKFFNLISRLGATGILIEYEDMFPYSGELASTRSSQAYSEKDVRQIVNWAKAYRLEVIPLVQTFGHLEWILKHPKFAKYREVERYAQVICLSSSDAVRLVKMAVEQVMAFHKDTSEFFHMGADEAFQIGMCERCQKTMRDELSNSRDRLMVRHIANISSFIREQYGKRVLMWHDMLNNVDPQVMKEYRIGELVEPVVWAYAENLNDYLMPDMWMRFASTFPYIWGASAYKGADGPSRFYSNIPHYVQNHVSWTSQMTREYKNFREFRGLILTGWQRFDHFAILCELLPVGVPSLAVNLLSIKYAVYDRNILKEASKLLECSNTLDPDSHGISAFCNFAGSKVYQYVQQFKISQQNMRTQLLDDYQLRGWLASFNIRHNYSSAWYLDQIVDKIHMYYNDINSLARMLRAELSKVFYADAVDEFIFEYVQEDLDRLNDLLKAAQRIGQIRTFPGRAFPIKLPDSATTSTSPPPNLADRRVRS